MNWRTQSFYRQTQNGIFVHSKATVTGLSIKSKLVLFATDTVELEGTHIPQGQLFQLQINPGSTGQACFFPAQDEYYPVSHQDFEIHAEPNDKLERHFVLAGSMLQDITEEVKEQAEQRISGRYDWALKKTQRGRSDGTSVESQQLPRAKDYLDSAQKHKCWTIV